MKSRSRGFCYNRSWLYFFIVDCKVNPLYIHICKQVTSKGTGFSMDQYGGSSEFVDEFLAILIPLSISGEAHPYGGLLNYIRWITHLFPEIGWCRISFSIISLDCSRLGYENRFETNFIPIWSDIFSKPTILKVGQQRLRRLWDRFKWGTASMYPPPALYMTSHYSVREDLIDLVGCIERK